MIKRILMVTGLTLAMSSVFPAVSEAQVCFQPAGFGNIYKLTLTPLSATNFVITGQENVFADRAVSGTAYLGVNQPGTLRMGFTVYSSTAAGSTDIQYNAVLNLTSPFAGSFSGWQDSFGTAISGAFNLVSCAGVPGPSEDLPDIHR